MGRGLTSKKLPLYSFMVMISYIIANMIYTGRGAAGREKKAFCELTNSVSARQAASTIFITAILCVPSRFREINLMDIIANMIYTGRGAAGREKKAFCELTNSVSARQAASTIFITAILCVPSRFREINLMDNMRPQ